MTTLTANSKKRLVGVGACYLDTILSVPHFVAEDEKLRASNIVRRRGGNCPNTLEVLQQLLASDDSVAVALNLISTLPESSSPAVQEIRSSLGAAVSTDTCIYRHGQSEPASSYIIKSLATGSRTIINYNALEEMKYDEFVQKSRSLDSGSEGMWYHFEGRIPDVTLRCIQYLRSATPRTTISVEVEKPGREGLQDLVPLVDVVFYSKSWAQSNGYKSAEECVLAQARVAPNALLLCCTWGEMGASALEPYKSKSICESAPAFKFADGRPIVDTVGAGDTFIAGILYSYISGHRDWTLQRRLGFANELAGRKVTQEGFAGLAQLVHVRHSGKYE
ncbi:pfkB family kinase [Xylariaceae sp. FL1651]|nr:pfkB family kinase [Xylariaceae sp. FL1651]